MNALHLPRLLLVMTIVSVSSCSAAPVTPSPVASSADGTLPSPVSSPSTQVVTLPPEAGAVNANTPPPAGADPTTAPNSTPGSSSPIVVTAPTTDCAVKMAIVSDPESPLNVRSSPDAQGNNVVGKLENKTFVTVAAEQEGWFQIDTPLTGWIAKSRTKYSCALVDEAIDLESTENQVLVKGEIIGSGSHQYRINLTAGQTLTINNEAEVFPRVLAPNDQSLNEDVVGTDAKQWSTTISITGEYMFQLDSNFRGFPYQFSVSLK